MLMDFDESLILGVRFKFNVDGDLNQRLDPIQTRAELRISGNGISMLCDWNRRKLKQPTRTQQKPLTLYMGTRKRGLHIKRGEVILAARTVMRLHS